MNLFVPHLDARESSRALADRHVVKMTLESAQVASTALGRGYRPTHRHHPTVAWASRSPVHTRIVVDFGLALATEYEHRFGRIHGSLVVLEDLFEVRAQGEVDAVLAEDPPPYVGEPAFADLPLELAYRALLTAKCRSWGPAARWTRREPPSWWISEDR